MHDEPTLILGAGPAGLTAGYLLAKQGHPVIVFEAEDQVGGIAKTEVREGPGGEYRFDLGGHRFFAKVQEVDDLWHEIMREEFLLRPRMSRIYWRKRFLHYPLQGGDVIRKLGPVELTRCMASYARAKLRPRGEEASLEQWVVNRFGRRLYENFFKSYNEKLWGVPVSEIRAEFAAQRIKGLSFTSAAKSAFFGNKDNEAEVRAAAQGLRYRDFLTVSLVLDGEDLFPDNWIYIHEPGVQVGRIQNFRSWSPWMVPDPSKACIGMEYFCFAGDELWEMDDEDLVQLAIGELEQLGLARRDALQFGFATRVPKAYPMYDTHYAERVAAIKDWLAGIENLQQVGRNGLHRYNNSDHSMLTAMRAVDNLVLGTDHDIWAVNAESVYHEEEHQDSEQPYIAAPETKSQHDPLAR